MGCAHASKILTVEDIEFIARNTAMTKAQVEVYHFIRNFILFHFISLNATNFTDSVSELPEDAS